MVMRRVVFKIKVTTVIGLLLTHFNLFLLAKDKDVNPYINCTTGKFYPTDQTEAYQNQQSKHSFLNFVSPNSTISPTDLAFLRQVRNSLNQQYLKDYGVTYDMLWGSISIKGLYQYDFEQVVNLLLSNPNISKKQGIAIFEGYCKKRCLHYEKKEYFGNKLKNWYDL